MHADFDWSILRNCENQKAKSLEFYSTLDTQKEWKILPTYL
jgi:hypothetical protein